MANYNPQGNRFKKGVSGNPNGRPSKRDFMEKVLGCREEDILEKACELALRGNPKMIEFLMSRCLPPASQDEIVNIPLKGKSFLEQGETVIDAMADGEITPRQAFAIMSNIQGHVKLAEATDIINRIKSLEEKINV